MINIDAERVRFEAWMRSKQFHYLTRGKGFGSENYANNRTQGQWHAWLAAKRDAITNEVSDEQAAG